jgi:tRNA 5-methylaminomethyl-2-thiouridine biosynthesis bifunctional protein
MNFLAAHGLPARWQGQPSFTFLQFDFANAQGFLQTWQAWQKDPKRSQRLHYLAFVSHKTPPACPHPDLAEFYATLMQNWPALCKGFQRLHFATGNVILTLIWGDTLNQLRSVSATIDAMDLNAPTSPAHYKALWRLSSANTQLVAYNNADAALQKSSGFDMAKYGGYYAGFCVRPPVDKSNKYPHQALIIGAGLAGTSIAERLADRGWLIDIIDAAPNVATKSSGNHAGLFHPSASRDDNYAARLSRVGCAETQQHLQRLKQAKLEVFFGNDGILQIAKDDAQAVLMQEIALQYPASLLKWLSQNDAEVQLGARPSHGGWWFAQGGWANPASICQANLAHWPKRITTHFGHKVDRIHQTTEGWQAIAADGRVIASSPVLIIANATEALDLLPELELPLSKTLRSTSLIADFEHPKYSLSGSGYLTAAFQGYRCIGAAEIKDNDLHAAATNNLAELHALLPGLATKTTRSSRACYRPNSLDRLPLVGALHDPKNIPMALHQLHQIPRQKGLYGLLGLGSRGLSWAIIAAEVLACQLNNDPAPLEADLIQALDPARFLLRKHRRSMKNLSISLQQTEQ